MEADSGLDSEDDTFFFPPLNEDGPLTVYRLATLHFNPVKVMHAHLHRLLYHHEQASKRNKTGIFREMLVYLDYWLATLYVVAEGFLELKLRDEVIDNIIHDHLDDLRLFRTATFQL